MGERVDLPGELPWGVAVASGEEGDAGMVAGAGMDAGEGLVAGKEPARRPRGKKCPIFCFRRTSCY